MRISAKIYRSNLLPTTFLSNLFLFFQFFEKNSKLLKVLAFLTRTALYATPAIHLNKSWFLSLYRHRPQTTTWLGNVLWASLWLVCSIINFVSTCISISRPSEVDWTGKIMKLFLKIIAVNQTLISCSTHFIEQSLFGHFSLHVCLNFN